MLITAATIMYLAMLSIYISTPLTLGLMIVVMAMMVSVMLFNFIMTSWFSYLLIMLFLSGIMVIFVYVSSLAANEFFSQIPLSNMLNPLMITLMMLPLMQALNSQSMSKMNPTDLHAMQMIYKIYTNQMYMFSIFLILYLLVALIVVVKNSSMTHAPLRST